MAHFNFVISQNVKWGHAGFYIDCHRMTVPENILLQKKHCLPLLPAVEIHFIIQRSAILAVGFTHMLYNFVRSADFATSQAQ